MIKSYIFKKEYLHSQFRGAQNKSIAFPEENYM